MCFRISVHVLNSQRNKKKNRFILSVLLVCVYINLKNLMAIYLLLFFY